VSDGNYDRVCGHCGDVFRVSPARLAAKKGTCEFCSRSCANKARARDIASRIDRKTDKSAGKDGCWPWTGVRDKNGYGFVQADGNAGLRRVARVLLEMQGGPLAEGEQACHHCDNPPCCNPAHLFRGTNAENHMDMVFKGRWRGRGPRRKPIPVRGDVV